MRAVFDEIGVVDVLKVVETDEGLLMIDGHLRQEELGDQEVYVAILDLNEEEQREMLTSFDPVGELSGIDSEIYIRLLERINPENAYFEQWRVDALKRMDDEVPTLADLEAEYPEPAEDAFWKAIVLKVPDATYERYEQVLDGMNGESQAERFADMLERAWTAND